MPTPLPITFRMSPLPEGVSYTQQGFADALVARLSADTQNQLVLFGTGSTLPTSDMGPFLLNGTTWYVWDVGTGAYIPQVIEFQTQLNPKPFRGNGYGSYPIVFSGPSTENVDLLLAQDFDPDSVLDDSTFTVPDDGFYHIDAKMAISATAGAPTGNIIIFYLKKNGFQMPRELDFHNIPDDDLGGHTYHIDTNIQLAAGDTIKASVGVTITGGSGTWTITENESILSGFKIRDLTF